MIIKPIEATHARCSHAVGVQFLYGATLPRWHGAHVDRTQSIPCLPWAVLSLVHLAMLRPSRKDEALASGYELVQPMASPSRARARNDWVRRPRAHQHANF
jgi:hypothetical protein